VALAVTIGMISLLGGIAIGFGLGLLVGWAVWSA
jgi:hypothetical protein